MSLKYVALKVELGSEFEGLAKKQTKIEQIFVLPRADEWQTNHHSIIYYIHNINVQPPNAG